MPVNGEWIQFPLVLRDLYVFKMHFWFVERRRIDQVKGINTHLRFEAHAVLF